MRFISARGQRCVGTFGRVIGDIQGSGAPSITSNAGPRGAFRLPPDLGRFFENRCACQAHS